MRKLEQTLPVINALMQNKNGGDGCGELQNVKRPPFCDVRAKKLDNHDGDGCI